MTILKNLIQLNIGIGLAVDIEYKRDKVSGDHLIIKDNAYGMDFRDFQRAIMLDSPPRKNLAVSLEWD